MAKWTKANPANKKLEVRLRWAAVHVYILGQQQQGKALESVASEQQAGAKRGGVRGWGRRQSPLRRRRRRTPQAEAKAREVGKAPAEAEEDAEESEKGKKKKKA